MKYIKLKELVTINPENINKNYPYNGIKYLDTANITNGKIDTIVDINIKDIPSRAKRIVKQNDIVYSTVRPNLCHYGLLRDVEENLIVSTGFVVIRCNLDKVLPEYLYAYLTLPEITIKLHSIAETSTSAYPSIKPSDIENLEIPLPTIEEQKRISKILSVLDLKMNLNTKTNDNLSEIIERMFINFLEKHNEELVTLEDAVKKIGTGADAIQRAPIVEYDTGIRCIRVGDMTNSRNRYEWGFTEMTEKDFDNYKLDIGDIVVTRTAVNGLSYMIEDDMKVVCNNGLIRMKVNEKYNPMFIYLYLKTKDFNEYVHRIDGETSVRPNMKVNYFTSYKIMKISKEEQDEICNRLLPLRNKQKQIIEENNTLTQLRDTLLPKLMNGEIDLDKIEI